LRSGQAGPGITEAGFDPLTALEKWVEDGVAPDSMLATKADKDGRLLWTRPLCAFPKKATYQGAGDIKDAASYRCSGTSPGRPFDVCFSDRPFGIKHFQTIHLCGVDVTRGLVFL
jgi:hypothetical protein